MLRTIKQSVQLSGYTKLYEPGHKNTDGSFIYSSIQKFIVVFVFFLSLTACSTKSDKKYFDEAQKYFDQKKYLEAVQSYEKLVKYHSQSDLAPQALFACGKIYQDNLIPSLSKKASLRKAVYYYREIYNRYQNKPAAEKALFMMAFIQANELNEIDSAKASYNLFLQKYPKSELAESARLERDNLGVSPDEILKKKLESRATK